MVKLLSHSIKEMKPQNYFRISTNRVHVICRSKSRRNQSVCIKIDSDWETDSEDNVTTDDKILNVTGLDIDGFHLVDEDIVFSRNSSDGFVQLGLSSFKLINRLVFNLNLLDRLELCRRCMQHHGHIFLVAQVQSSCAQKDSESIRVMKIETWHCLNALFHDTGGRAYERVSEYTNSTISDLEKIWGWAKCNKFAELSATGGNNASLTLISVWLSNQYPGPSCTIVDVVFDLVHFLMGNIELNLERFCMFFRLLTALTISIMQQLHVEEDVEALSVGNYWKVTVRILPQIVELFGRMMWLCSKP